MTRTLALLVAASFLFDAAAQDQAAAYAERPQLAPGDQWVMQKIDLWTGGIVQRVRSEITAVNEREATLAQTVFSTNHGPEGARETKTVDVHTWTVADSRRSASSMELSFPLTVGKKWTAEFKTPSPNPNYQIPHTRTARVDRWESVTVPAGTFTALRISYETRLMLFIADGIFPAYINETVWYVPAAKWYVKREEIVRNPLKKIETQFLEELVEMRVARP